MQEHILGTLGWPFQAPNSAYGLSTLDIEADTLIPLHPIPSSQQIYEYLQLYCSKDSFLVVSPYTMHHHLLDLRRVGTPQQLMAKALTVMASLRRDFAIAPYDEAFNWPTVMNALRGLAQDEGFSWQRQEFHVIVFRSTLAPTADYLRLGEMDERAHAEATKSGGLLKYWFGEPDVHGRNLATCIWRNHEDTKGGSGGDQHQSAMKMTKSWFAKWAVERKKLVVGDKVQHWWFEDWTEDSKL